MLFRVHQMIQVVATQIICLNFWLFLPLHKSPNAKKWVETLSQTWTLVPIQLKINLHTLVMTLPESRKRSISIQNGNMKCQFDFVLFLGAFILKHLYMTHILIHEFFFFVFLRNLCYLLCNLYRVYF
jgi:hypothetical protein